MADLENPRRCPGHLRHWFTIIGYVGLRAPTCTRCGAPNPRPLSDQEQRGWDYYLVSVGQYRTEAFGPQPALSERWMQMSDLENSSVGHRMVPGSHERPRGAECVCGGAWDRWTEQCVNQKGAGR